MPATETNKLTDWTICPSRNGLVITGHDTQGQPRKFSGVIDVQGGSTAIAWERPLPDFTHEGVKWELAS